MYSKSRRAQSIQLHAAHLRDSKHEYCVQRLLLSTFHFGSLYREYLSPSFYHLTKASALMLLFQVRNGQ